MIISLERNDDKTLCADILEITEIAVREYLATKNTELLIHIDWLNEWYDSVQLKVESGDYTADDRRRKRVDKILNG